VPVEKKGTTDGFLIIMSLLRFFSIIYVTGALHTLMSERILAAIISIPLSKAFKIFSRWGEFVNVGQSTHNKMSKISVIKGRWIRVDIKHGTIVVGEQRRNLLKANRQIIAKIGLPLRTLTGLTDSDRIKFGEKRFNKKIFSKRVIIETVKNRTFIDELSSNLRKLVTIVFGAFGASRRMGKGPFVYVSPFALYNCYVRRPLKLAATYTQLWYNFEADFYMSGKERNCYYKELPRTTAYTFIEYPITRVLKVRETSKNMRFKDMAETEYLARFLTAEHDEKQRYIQSERADVRLID
jgi:hypothetical protein